MPGPDPTGNGACGLCAWTYGQPHRDGPPSAEETYTRTRASGAHSAVQRAEQAQVQSRTASHGMTHRWSLRANFRRQDARSPVYADEGRPLQSPRTAVRDVVPELRRETWLRNLLAVDLGVLGHPRRLDDVSSVQARTEARRREGPQSKQPRSDGSSQSLLLRGQQGTPSLEGQPEEGGPPCSKG
jgi:hypothetical protein